MDTQELQRLKNKFDIIGNDPSLNHALETAVSVAPTDLTVLITGESGVGKENLPKIIHQFSRRKTGKYLAVNCGAIPPGTINAELFGHEKGAFTGAIGERKGYFEEADGGTLFLDEIGELPKDTQAMLLRVLQSGEFIKVGSSKVEKTDVRVVASTNVNLSYAVAMGKFREDLFFRLAGIQIQMPALRDRAKDDIYLLFRKFSSDFAEKYNLRKLSLSHDAINVLTSYRWPGNIRQLKNIAESVTALESQPATPGAERIEISADVIAARIPQEQGGLILKTAPDGSQGAFTDSEREQIIKAIVYLKQEVDALKEIINSERRPAEKRTDKPMLGVSGDMTIKMPDTDYSSDEEIKAAEEQSPAPRSMRDANDSMIERCLAKNGGKVKFAAAELGISERTIYRYLQKKKTEGKK